MPDVGYVVIPVEESAEAIERLMIADYQARVPGWVPNPADPIMRLIGIFALRYAVLQTMFTEASTAVFRYKGQQLNGVQPKEATFATVSATFHVAELGPGHEVMPSGLIVAVEGPEGPVRFQTVGGETISSEAEPTVTLQAEKPGPPSNEISGEGRLITPLTWLSNTVVLIGASAGGSEAEAEQTYLGRVATKLQEQTDTIVTVFDAERAVREIPGIGRCLVLKGYVPAVAEVHSVEENQPGQMSLVITTNLGSNCSGGEKTEAEALVLARSADGVTVYILNPTRTDVSVEYTALALSGWNTEVVKAECDAAVTAYFNNAVWGEQPNGEWEDTKTVRYSDLYAALKSAQGVQHVTLVKINGSSNTNATITGPGALPTLTSVTGTVT